MVYEGQYPEIQIAQELIKKLGNDLRRLMGNNPAEKNDLIGEFPDFRESILNYSTQEFAKSFGFEYSEASTPPNTKPGGKVVTYEGLFRFQTLPVTESDVRQWIDSELFL